MSISPGTWPRALPLNRVNGARRGCSPAPSLLSDREEPLPTIRLIALDLDGTLFNEEGEISREDAAAIREASDRGVTVVISTGRPYCGVPVEEVAPLGVHCALTVNGAAVYTLPDRKLLFDDCMDARTALGVLRDLEPLNLYYDVFIDGDAYSREDRRALLEQTVLPESAKAYIRRTRIYESDLLGRIEREALRVQKVTINFCRQDGALTGREEAERILSGSVGAEPKRRTKVNVGDTVRITSGAFEDYAGKITSIDMSSMGVKVDVDGKSLDVEIDQVELI